MLKQFYSGTWLQIWKRRYQRLQRLSWKMKLIPFVSYFLMGLVRCAILLVPFKYLSRILGENNGDTSAEEEREAMVRAAKVGWIVETMSRYTPWESKCLVQAITAQLLLSAAHTPSTLYLGMAKDSAGQLIAHAWLRCGDLILTGAQERARFKTVAQFARFPQRQ